MSTQSTSFNFSNILGFFPTTIHRLIPYLNLSASQHSSHTTLRYVMNWKSNPQKYFRHSNFHINLLIYTKRPHQILFFIFLISLLLALFILALPQWVISVTIKMLTNKDQPATTLISSYSYTMLLPLQNLLKLNPSHPPQKWLNPLYF